MSINAVLCLTDGAQTIRLTRYGCKPTVFLRQLVSALTAAGGVGIVDFQTALLAEGFEVDHQIDVEAKPAAVFDGQFHAEQMQASMPVNWAWLLDVDKHSLSYWDVMACLNGMAGTVAAQPGNPLSHLDWVAEHKKAEMREHFLDCFARLDELGIKVVNC